MSGGREAYLFSFRGWVGIVMNKWMLAGLGISSAVALLRCTVDSCPEGTRARFDQCVRVAKGGDAGDADDALDGGIEGAPSDATLDSAGCEGEWVPSAGRCVLRQVYVDSVNGDDTNPGTSEQPLKTFNAAVGGAVAGQIVNFEPREYATAAGDRFTALVRDGVTLRTRPDREGQASFVADGSQSLVFQGSAGLVGIRLVGFDSPLRSITGEQRLRDVSFSGATGSVLVAGDAHTVCDGCQFEARAGRSTPLIRVSAASTLTLVRTTLFTAADAPCEPAQSDAIQVADSANLRLREVHLSGKFDHGARLETEGHLQIHASTFEQGCAGNALALLRDWFVPSRATVDIQNSLFETSFGVTGGVAHVRVRGSTFKSLFGIAFTADGVYDLGRPAHEGVAEPGLNTFTEVVLSGVSAVFFASGNTWPPNVQDAGANGHYPEGEVWSVSDTDSIQGPSISLHAHGETVRLYF